MGFGPNVWVPVQDGYTGTHLTYADWRLQVSSDVENLITLPLTGSSEGTLDDKGRLLLSKAQRDSLGSNFVMYRSSLGCACAVSRDEFLATYAKIRSHDHTHPSTQEYSEMVMGDAEMNLECDQQGRVVIPRKLRAICKLEGNVIVRGAGYFLEIWDSVERRVFEENRVKYGGDRRERMDAAYREMLAS